MTSRVLRTRSLNHLRLRFLGICEIGGNAARVQCDDASTCFRYGDLRLDDHLFVVDGT